jgi:ferrochelatase
MKSILLVNFGGPRHLAEIEEFLRELLCDRDVIRTRFPTFLHNWLFSRIARKRALAIRHDYQLIGGRSPIFFDTEDLARELGALTFHRYLPATHEDSLRQIEASQAPEIRVLPLFPQFTYATTGSIARFFAKHLSRKTETKLRWIKSYPAHPAFVEAFQRKIREFLARSHFAEEETILLFSAHGVPQIFIDRGDPYQAECEDSYRAISAAFPNALSRLAYQSKFGRGEWLRPSTNEVCEKILDWHQGRKNIVFVPLTFPSDHIETLFEVEYQYLPLIRAHNLNAYRCPALNRESYWIEAVKILLQETELHDNKALIR